MLGFKPASRSPLNPSQCQVTLQLQIKMMRRRFLFHRQAARCCKKYKFWWQFVNCVISRRCAAAQRGRVKMKSNFLLGGGNHHPLLENHLVLDDADVDQNLVIIY